MVARNFPARAAFPKWQEGRHPHCHFRGLLRLHTCYGPPDRSAAQGDLCHEAPALPVTRPSRSSATRINRQFFGWILPPQVIRAFGAHCHFRTFSRTCEPTWRDAGDRHVVVIHYVKKQTARHCGEDNNIQAPATIQATPAARATLRPNGVTFSRRTSSARSAIQRTFITPPTNNSAIRTQQQPTQ